MNTLITVGAFLVAIGVLVTVHEFGHYWVARRLGVKVLKFSIGFGRNLFSWHGGRDRTEYAIAVLPLGGYVKMLDEREGEVAEAELHRAHNRQPLPSRAAIALAGPAFNLLFAVLAYWVVFVVGIPGLRPVVGPVTPHSPAAEAGFRHGDEIISVGGSPTPTWEAAGIALLNGVMNGGPIRIQARQPEGAPRTLELHAADTKALTRPGALLPGLGFSVWQPKVPALIGQVVPNSPAGAAGLRRGDKVIRSAGKPISGWQQWVDFIRAHPGQTVPVIVRRDGATQTLTLHIGTTQQNGETIGHIGAAPKVPDSIQDRLFAVEQYAPLAALGHAFGQTWEISSLTVRMFWEMATGHASWKNMSGPIGIADYAGSAASAGLVAFAGFLAVISISLAVLNLLPIPILDGGHLLYYALEWVKGGPLSMRAEMIGQQIGAALLLLLIGFAVFNDLTRLVG